MTGDAQAIPHIARGRLESLAAGVLSGAARVDVEQHVSRCSSCQARLDGLRRARSRYEEAQPAADFARAVMARAATSPAPEPSRVRTWLLAQLQPLRLGLAAGVVALALIAAVVGPVGNTIRYKGKSPIVWNVFVKRSERPQPWRASEGDILRPGDQLAFAYTVQVDRYLSVFGIDEAGQVTAYGPSAPVLLRRREDRVPFGIELDGRRGDERLFAFLSPAPLDPAVVRGCLTTGWARARAENRSLKDMTVDLPAEAELRTLWFKKP